MTVVDPRDPRRRFAIWTEALLVGVVVLIVVGVRACSRARANDEPGGGASTSGSVEGSAAPTEVEASAPSASRVEADAETRPTAPQPEDATDRVAQVGPADGLEVLVVDDASGRPVAGAEVAFDLNCDQRFDRSLLWKDPAAARRSATAVYRADEKGVARVPWPGEAAARTLVWCLHADRRACAAIGSFTPTPIELRLRAPSSIPVRVVDASAAPIAGVVVAIGESDDLGEIDWSDASRAATGADGIVAIQGVELLRPASAERRRGVGVPLLAGLEPFAPIDAARPPTDPVTLVLPAVGTIRFRVVDGEGRRLPADGDVNVMRATGDGEVDSSRQQRAEIREGIGELVVPIGFRYYGLASAPRLKSNEAWFDGPRAGGEVVAVDLVSLGIGPWLVGRVVDLARTPIRDADLEVDLLRASGPSMQVTRSDAVGRFRIDGRREEPDASRRTLTLTWSRDDRLTSLRGSIELPDRLGEGELDVGEVLLAPRNVLVSGRVVDDRGRAVAGADVGVEFHHPLSEAAEASLDFALRSGAGVHTGMDGRFTFFGDPELGVGELVAMLPEGSRSAPAPFHPGDRDVVIELVRPGRIVGRILADQALDGRGLQLRLRRSEEADAGNSSTYCIDMSEGRFTLAAVPAGSWTLELAAIDGEEPELLAAIPDITVLAGEVTRDARLDPLDLRGRLHVVHVVVVPPLGVVADQTIVRLFAPDASVPLRVVSGRYRRFTFVVTGPEVTVDVWAPRCRHAVREHVRESTTIELVRGTTVPLTVRLGGRELVELLASERDATWFIVSCVPEGSVSTMDLLWMYELAGDAPIRFELPDVGRWEVRARLVDRRDGQQHPVEFESGTLLLDVRDSTPLDVTLPLTLDALRAAFDEFAKHR